MVGVSGALGCTAEVTVSPLTPALVNDPAVTGVVRDVATDLVGKENITELRTMGSEDMAYVNQQVPGCYLMIGSSNRAAGLTRSHHNPFFDFDEDALPLAVGLLCAAAVRLMSQRSVA